VTSGISRYVSFQSFGGAHRGRVCIRVFIGVSVRACCERLRCTVSFSKKLKNVAPFFKQKVEPMGPSEVLIGVGFAYAYS
jgi:hypothetical protein